MRRRQRQGQVSRVTPYTGFPLNTQQFIQPQRSAGIPMGGSSVTTGPAKFQEDQSASTPLGGLLAAKESYDQANKAYKGGQKLAAKAKSFGSDAYGYGEDLVTGTKNIFSDTTALTNAGAGELLRSPDISNAWGGGTASRFDMGGVPGSVKNLGTNIDPTFTFGSTGQTGATGLPPGISDALLGKTEIMGKPVSGLTSNAPAVPAGTNYLGAAGGALGVGLNVSDMVENGVSFGNVTGAIGSGILGASALTVGAINAWNPVGWALLAASALDSIFDIF